MGLPVIAEDKANHAIYGAAVAVVAHLAVRLVVQTSAPIASVAALGTVAAVAIGKELADRSHPASHTSDWRDALATFAGGLAACATLALGSV